jgi:hypothetical protein
LDSLWRSTGLIYTQQNHIQADDYFSCIFTIRTGLAAKRRIFQGREWSRIYSIATTLCSDLFSNIKLANFYGAIEYNWPFSTSFKSLILLIPRRWKLKNIYMERESTNFNLSSASTIMSMNSFMHLSRWMLIIFIVIVTMQVLVLYYTSLSSSLILTSLLISSIYPYSLLPLRSANSKAQQFFNKYGNSPHKKKKEKNCCCVNSLFE